MNEHLRQTGRTTRMLAEAVSLLAQGFSVAIYTHDERYARILQSHARNQFPALNRAGFVAIPDDFNWSTMRPRRDPNPSSTRYLVDHAAVEFELQKIDENILRLQQLTRQLYPFTAT